METQWSVMGGALRFLNTPRMMARRDKRLVMRIDSQMPKFKQIDNRLLQAEQSGDVESAKKALTEREGLLEKLEDEFIKIIQHNNAQFLALTQKAKTARASIQKVKAHSQDNATQRKLAKMEELINNVLKNVTDYLYRTRIDLQNLFNEKNRAGYRALLGQGQLHADMAGAEYKVWQLTRATDKLIGRLKSAADAVDSVIKNPADGAKAQQAQQAQQNFETAVNELGAALSEESKMLSLIAYDTTIELMSLTQEELARTRAFVSKLRKEGFPETIGEELDKKAVAAHEQFHTKMNRMFSQIEVVLREAH